MEKPKVFLVDIQIPQMAEGGHQLEENSGLDRLDSDIQTEQPYQQSDHISSKQSKWTSPTKQSFLKQIIGPLHYSPWPILDWNCTCCSSTQKQQSLLYQEVSLYKCLQDSFHFHLWELLDLWEDDQKRKDVHDCSGGWEPGDEFYSLSYFSTHFRENFRSQKFQLNQIPVIFSSDLDHDHLTGVSFFCLILLFLRSWLLQSLPRQITVPKSLSYALLSGKP